MTPEQMVEEENRRAGRSVPSWRYYVAFLSTFWLGEIARFAQDKFGFWPYLAVWTVAVVLWVALLSQYVKKGIR